MTEQPPSASKEALDLAERIRDWQTAEWVGAAEIDALCEQRVAAETERWQNRDRQRLEQIGRLQQAAQFFQSARAERPAPERRLTGGERKVLHKALLASSRLVHEGELAPALAATAEQQPFRDAVRVAFDNFFARKLATRRASVEPTGTGEQPASPAAVVDYTERARVVSQRWAEANYGPPSLVRLTEMIADALYAVASERDAALHAAPSPSVVDYTERARAILRAHSAPPFPSATLSEDIAAALSAVASERDATAIRAFGKRVWSDGEDVAYQAGVSDTLARLREPDVREAVIHALMTTTGWVSSFPGKLPLVAAGLADAAIAKIAETLK